MSQRQKDRHMIHRMLYVSILMGLFCLNACGQDVADQAPTDKSALEHATQSTGKAPHLIEMTLSFRMPRLRLGPIEVQVDGFSSVLPIPVIPSSFNLWISTLRLYEIPQESMESGVPITAVVTKEERSFCFYCWVQS